MKISRILQVPTVRILLYLLEKGQVRHSELAKIIASRGTLSLSLKELEEEGLVRRRIVDSKPIRSFYSLTPRGAEIAKYLDKIEKLYSKGAI